MLLSCDSFDCIHSLHDFVRRRHLVLLDLSMGEETGDLYEGQLRPSFICHNVLINFDRGSVHELVFRDDLSVVSLTGDGEKTGDEAVVGGTLVEVRGHELTGTVA